MFGTLRDCGFYKYQNNGYDYRVDKKPGYEDFVMAKTIVFEKHWDCWNVEEKTSILVYSDFFLPHKKK